jgi:hypothetical protein
LYAVIPQGVTIAYPNQVCNFTKYLYLKQANMEVHSLLLDLSNGLAQPGLA